MTSQTAFQSTAETVRQVRSGLGYGLLKEVGLLTLSGPDALTFLQNRTTNDVSTLQSGQGQASALADRKGHVQATFSLHRDGDTYWLLTERDQLPLLQEELLKYKIMEVVTLTDQTDAYQVLTLQGPRAIEILPELAPFALQSLQVFGQELRVLQKSFSGETGYCLLVPTDQTCSVYQALQAESQAHQGVELSAEALEILRLEAGIPKMGVDMDPNTLLPETGLEQTSVSYSKGCYLGQETIARVKTYGAVQRALVGLLFPTGTLLPERNTPIFHDGRLIGTLKSHGESPTLKQTIAMAYLGKDERLPGRQLTLEMAGKSYEATVTLLPFYQKVSQTQEISQSEAQALLKQGLEAFASGQEDEAINRLQAAITADPNLGDAYEALGVILSRQERFTEAVALMDKLVEIDPGRVMAHTNLSIYYMKLGDKEKAEEEKAKATLLGMQKAMQTGGQVSSTDAARMQREKALLERIELFKEALQYGPDDALTNFGLGSAYLELGNYGLAIIPLEKTIQTQPTHSVAYLSLGKAYEGVGNREKAQTVYEHGIEVASKRGDLMPLQEMQGRLSALAG